LPRIVWRFRSRSRAQRSVYAAREAGVDLISALGAFIEQQGVLARSLSVARAVDEFLEVRENENKSVAHVKDLRMRLRAFTTAVDDDDDGVVVASITTRDVDSWLSSLRVAPQTRLNCRRALHNFFGYCFSRGYASRTVVASASMVKVPPRARGILTTGETRALLASCPGDPARCRDRRLRWTASQ
jgi:site-specific recombinase XerD